MNIQKEVPVWRSMLYVPATSEKFIEKAHERGADAIKIDLEDAVAPQEKPTARTLIKGAAELVARGGADVLVRINRPTRMAVADIEASVWPEVNGLVLPKVESADHVHFLDEIITELEEERGMQAGHIQLMALVETPRGYSNVREISHSSPRLSAIALGQEDFSAEMGMAEPEGMSLLSYYQTVQVAAREAGILPIDDMPTSIRGLYYPTPVDDIGAVGGTRMEFPLKKLGYRRRRRLHYLDSCQMRSEQQVDILLVSEMKSVRLNT